MSENSRFDYNSKSVTVKTHETCKKNENGITKLSVGAGWSNSKGVNYPVIIINNDIVE